MLLFILQANGMSSILMMLVVFIIMYFFMLRPQINKQKEQGTFQSNLKKGDEVVTASGIIGKINKIDGKEVTLDLDNGKTFIRCTTGAISKEMTDAFFKDK